MLLLLEQWFVVEAEELHLQLHRRDDMTRGIDLPSQSNSPGRI